MDARGRLLSTKEAQESHEAIAECDSSFLKALILLPYNISIILKLRAHIEERFISRLLNFFKNLSSSLKIIR